MDKAKICSISGVVGSIIEPDEDPGEEEDLWMIP